MAQGFDALEIGQVDSLGVTVVDGAALTAFRSSFAPDWPEDAGAPPAMIYALWSRLADAAMAAEEKRLGVDALRWLRDPPAGELLRGRVTVMGLDPVGDTKGVVIAQHDLLDEAGRLVFSCLTRSVLPR
jgi:hypothetical protein